MQKCSSLFDRSFVGGDSIGFSEQLVPALLRGNLTVSCFPFSFFKLLYQSCADNSGSGGNLTLQRISSSVSLPFPGFQAFQSGRQLQGGPDTAHHKWSFEMTIEKRLTKTR